MAMGYDADVVHKEKDSALKVNSQELVARIFTVRGEEHLMDVDGIIQRMRQVYAVKNDSELALALGLTKSAASNWRNRNSPPVDICIDTACKKGISLDWLFFGVGDMRLGVREAAPANSTPDSAQPAPGPAAERLSQFVYWWHVNRTQDEMIWLEQQFKRTVSEYGEWLVNPVTVIPR